MRKQFASQFFARVGYEASIYADNHEAVGG